MRWPWVTFLILSTVVCALSLVLVPPGIVAIRSNGPPDCATATRIFIVVISVSVMAGVGAICATAKLVGLRKERNRKA